MKNQKKRYRIVTVVTFGAIVAVWEISSRYRELQSHGNELLPAFSQVFLKELELFQTVAFYKDVLISYSRICVGFSLGTLLGVTFGVLTATKPLLNAIFTPVFNILRPLPPIALIPIVIVLFGLNEYSKYLMILAGTFFPIWIATYLGIQNINPVYIKISQTLHLSKLQVIMKVLLPGSVTTIAAGVRTGLAVAFFCLVAAEMSGAQSGLYYRINIAYTFFNFDEMLAGLIFLGISSFLADRILVYIFRRYFLPSRRSG